MTFSGSTGVAEERRRDARDLGSLLVERARRRPAWPRCRRSWSSSALQRLADAPDEQRDVGALPAAVGVQLVEDEEPQALAPPSTSCRSYGPREDSSSIT